MAMVLPEGPQIGAIFGSAHQTYTISEKVKDSTRTIHFLCINEIDAINKRIILETLDPNKNFTVDQCKDLAYKFKVIVVEKDSDNKVTINVIETHRDTIPTKDLQLFIKSGGKVSSLCKVHMIRLCDNKEYQALLKDYAQFVRIVLKHNAQQVAAKK